MQIIINGAPTPNALIYCNAGTQVSSRAPRNLSKGLQKRFNRMIIAPPSSAQSQKQAEAQPFAFSVFFSPNDDAMMIEPPAPIIVAIAIRIENTGEISETPAISEVFPSCPINSISAML